MCFIASKLECKSCLVTYADCNKFWQQRILWWCPLVMPIMHLHGNWVLVLLLQGFCVSCLFCFANMDVHHAMLPLLKQLFGSSFGGDSAMTAQRANTVTHSMRDLGVWLCCRRQRAISDQHGQELEMYWPNQASAFSLLSSSYVIQSKITVTGQFYAVAVVTT